MPLFCRYSEANTALSLFIIVNEWAKRIEETKAFRPTAEGITDKASLQRCKNYDGLHPCNEQTRYTCKNPVDELKK